MLFKCGCFLWIKSVDDVSLIFSKQTASKLLYATNIQKSESVLQMYIVCIYVLCKQKTVTVEYDNFNEKLSIMSKILKPWVSL